HLSRISGLTWVGAIPKTEYSKPWARTHSVSVPLVSACRHRTRSIRLHRRTTPPTVGLVPRSRRSRSRARLLRGRSSLPVFVIVRWKPVYGHLKSGRITIYLPAGLKAI